MPASIAASMIGTFRSYQVLLITQSQCFSSRTRAAESRASTETAVARSSRCEAANAFAFDGFRPAMPTRSTPGLARRSGTVDWAIAPYPPRMSTSNRNPVSQEDRTSLILFARVSGVRDSRRPEYPGTGEYERHARCERGPVSEDSGHEAPEQGPEDRPEPLDRVERSEGPRPSALRCQMRHERAARDVDHGPTRSD